MSSTYSFEVWSIHKLRGHNTGKSLSEALILVSTNPQYDKRLNYEFSTWKFKLRTCWQHVVYTNCFLFFFWHSEQFMYLLSYCGLVDTRISASEKDLPVWNTWPHGVEDTLLTGVNDSRQVEQAQAVEFISVFFFFSSFNFYVQWVQ